MRQHDYYYQFYSLVEDINKTYNIFDGEQVTEDYDFLVFDEEDAIERFRGLCQTGDESLSAEGKCWFYLIAYYLNARGYVIEQFPHVLRRPPKEPYDFKYTEIRNQAVSQGLDEGGNVRWAVRRTVVAGMRFVLEGYTVAIEETLDLKVQAISSRNASFEAMGVDEKLKEIANLIENLLKVEGGFVQPDYSEVMFDYVTDDTVRSLRKKLQCFRHSSEESLEERALFTAEQKSFLVDYGVTVCKAIHVLVR